MSKKKKWVCSSCEKKQDKDEPKFRVYNKDWEIQKGVSQCYKCFAKNCI